MFGQVSQAIDRGDSYPTAFDLLHHVLSRQSDHGDAASSLTELQKFGVPNGYPLRGILPRFSDGSLGGDGQ